MVEEVALIELVELVLILGDTVMVVEVIAADDELELLEDVDTADEVVVAAVDALDMLSLELVVDIVVVLILELENDTVIVMTLLELEDDDTVVVVDAALELVFAIIAQFGVISKSLPPGCTFCGPRSSSA